MQQLEGIANKLITELNSIGIECYIWHLATTGSVYIRFKDNRMCSIRIGTHDGREKLKYKYNIRTDIGGNHKTWVKDENIWRYYVLANNWKEIIPVLQDRYNQIQNWEPSKYKYLIPKFKIENDK